MGAVELAYAGVALARRRENEKGAKKGSEAKIAGFFAAIGTWAHFPCFSLVGSTGVGLAKLRVRLAVWEQDKGGPKLTA